MEMAGSMLGAATRAYGEDSAGVRKSTIMDSGLNELFSTLSDIEGGVTGLHRRVCGSRPEAVDQTSAPKADNYAGRVQAMQEMTTRIAGKLREIGEQV